MNYQPVYRLFLIVTVFLVNGSNFAHHANNVKKENTTFLTIPHVLALSATMSGTAYLLGANPELRKWVFNNPRKIATTLGVYGGFSALVWLHNKLTSSSVSESLPANHESVWYGRHDTVGTYLTDPATSNSWSFAEKCGLSIFGTGIVGGFAYHMFNKPAIIQALQSKIATSTIAQLNYKPFAQVSGAIAGVGVCMYGGYRLLNKGKKIITDFKQCSQVPDALRSQAAAGQTLPVVYNSGEDKNDHDKK